MQFSSIIGTKTWPCTPLLFIGKGITSTLSLILLEKNGNAFNLWSPVFPRSLFFLRSWVPVGTRFFYDAENDEQIHKLQKQSAHIKMMAVFRQQVPIVYLSVTTGSHLMLEKKNYLSKGKWEGTCLLNQTWGKETDTWWKVGTWKFADKIWRDLKLIILMFSLIFRSSFFSSKCRRFIVAVCFSFSIIISNLLELRDFHDIFTSQHLLNSVHVGNTGEPSVCFVPWLFCRLPLNL